MDLFNDLVNLSRMKAVMDTRNHILAMNDGDNAARFIAEVTARRDVLIANGEKLDYQALKNIVSDVLKDQKLLCVERHDLYLRYDVAHNEWHGIPKDLAVYCNGEPDRIKEVYAYTPNIHIDLVYYKADDPMLGLARARVWVEDTQAETQHSF